MLRLLGAWACTENDRDRDVLIVIAVLSRFPLGAGCTSRKITGGIVRRNVIRTHLYWGYRLSRAEELLKVTALCPTVCNLACEREDVTIDLKKVTCPACRERAKAKSEEERTAS
jgi:hypothetical protein